MLKFFKDNICLKKVVLFAQSIKGWYMKAHYFSYIDRTTAATLRSFTTLLEITERIIVKQNDINLLKIKPLAIEVDKQNLYRDTTHLIWLPDGKHFISVHARGVFQLWDLFSAKLISEGAFIDWMVDVEFDEEVEDGEENKVYLYYYQSALIRKKLNINPTIHFFVFATYDDEKLARYFPKKPYIISKQVDKKEINIDEIGKNEKFPLSLDYDGSLDTVEITSDGKFYAFLDKDGRSFSLYDMLTLKPVQSYQGSAEEISSLVLTYNDCNFIAGSKDGTVTVWDRYTGLVVKRFRGHTKAVCIVLPSFENKTFFSVGDDNEIKLWCLKSGELLGTFSGHQNIINSISMSPDEKYLISSDNDGIIKVWDIEQKEEIYSSIFFKEDKGWISFNKKGFFVTDDKKNRRFRFCDKEGKTLPSTYFAYDLYNKGSFEEYFITRDLLRNYTTCKDDAFVKHYDADKISYLCMSTTGALIRRIFGNIKLEREEIVFFHYKYVLFMMMYKKYECISKVELFHWIFNRRFLKNILKILEMKKEIFIKYFHQKEKVYLRAKQKQEKLQKEYKNLSSLKSDGTSADLDQLIIKKEKELLKSMRRFFLVKADYENEALRRSFEIIKQDYNTVVELQDRVKIVQKIDLSLEEKHELDKLYKQAREIYFAQDKNLQYTLKQTFNSLKAAYRRNNLQNLKELFFLLQSRTGKNLFEVETIFDEELRDDETDIFERIVEMLNEMYSNPVMKNVYLLKRDKFFSDLELYIEMSLYTLPNYTDAKQLSLPHL